MSSSTFVGNPNVMVAGPPPPPPPPPPVSGQLPAMRMKTAENTPAKKPQIINNDVYEPPAAIQNAMLTKDKKPFTYTPGMGGKLDLSQIRSPRMARRVAKNANDEGIEGPPKLAGEPKPAASVTANLMVQPQVAVPVFPTNVPPPSHANRVSQPSSINRISSNAIDKQPEPLKIVTKVDTKMVPIITTSSQSSTPESPNTPTQITLAKAPTPWLQNKNKPQEDLPEWAKRANANKVVGSPSSESAPSPTTVYVQVQQSPQSPPQQLQTKPKQEQEQHPTPQYQCQQVKPQQSSQQCQRPRQSKQNTDSATSQQTNSQSHQHECIIPIRIEDRPSVFDVKRESGHHQFKQPPTLHHQQRWGQAPAQHTLENQSQNRSQGQEQSQIHVATLSRPEQPVGTTYIIPLVVEDDKKSSPNNMGNNTPGKAVKVVQQRGPASIQQQEPGPVQSRSFRVLQKITDTDTSNDVGADQIRKLELSEDERLLMNKFKEQVDHETYLHQEEDPRYRGAAIPSRAFRFLQNMTDSSDASVTCAAPRNAQNVAYKKQNRNSKSFEETQANLPPSEQQVQEPKKYMGSAIPSRSFRILQAMTAPESIATQENHQADYTCRTENNMPGDQQSVFVPSPSVPFWYPEGWWGYYPIQYNVLPNEPANQTDKHTLPSYVYPPYQVGYESFYPIYNEDFVDDPCLKVTSRENPSGQYSYATGIYPQAGYNDVQQSYVDAKNYNHVHLHPTAANSSFAQDDQHYARDGLVETKNTVLSNGINHLDAQSNGMYNSRNVNENCSNDKNCIITAMNIVDEENDIPDNPKNVVVFNNIEIPKKTFGLRVNVPNYTYTDTSDSSTSSDSTDSSDSSDSISDNEQLSDSCQKNCSRNHDTTSNNTSSDSDSDSYIAYSTGLNPYEKLERESCSVSSDKNCTDITTYLEYSASADNLGNSRNDSESNIHSEKTCSGKNQFDYSDVQNSRTTFEQDIMCVPTKEYNDENYIDDGSNLDSCSGKIRSNDRELYMTQNQKNPTTDNTVSHQSSVIYEDMERLNFENPCCESKKDIDERNETSIETTDDPPDDTESTMVSVSLPLRFKFSVSEDNEDITTVTVGDSKIKAEKSCNVKSEDSMKDEMDDVHVNFHVGNDTSVNFTIKRHVSDAASVTTSTKDKAVNIETAIPHVDFTLKKDPMRISEISCVEQNAEMKFTVTKMEHDRMNTDKSESKDIDDYTVSELVKVAQDTLLNNGNCAHVQSEYSYTQDNLEVPQIEIIDANQTDRKNCTIVDNSNDRCTNLELHETNAKHLLSIQDSHEDTDDEDSGVTSDISRMISEVDTDSECTSSKNLKKYQRTQTHSRLFRLLNDGSILSDCSKTDPSYRKEYLSLPLNTNTFNYDDNYCSNYSSGLTSPEYSPIHEQSWRRFQDATNRSTAGLPNTEVDHMANQTGQVSSKNDPYFRVWKSSKLTDLHEHDVVPSLAFKILDSKIPFWAYKVNVLCPRIKSTKNVPQTLLARQTGKNNDPPPPSSSLPEIVPIPTSCANSKTNYC